MRSAVVVTAPYVGFQQRLFDTCALRVRGVALVQYVVGILDLTMTAQRQRFGELPSRSRNPGSVSASTSNRSLETQDLVLSEMVNET
jgi:hypothetical protein